MKQIQSSLEKLFSVKSWGEPQPSLSAWGVDTIKLLASTFILKPLMNHVKYGHTFALIYVDFHTLRLGDFWVFTFFWCQLYYQERNLEVLLLWVLFKALCHGRSAFFCTWLFLQLMLPGPTPHFSCLQITIALPLPGNISSRPTSLFLVFWFPTDSLPWLHSRQVAVAVNHRSQLMRGQNTKFQILNWNSVRQYIRFNWTGFDQALIGLRFRVKRLIYAGWLFPQILIVEMSTSSNNMGGHPVTLYRVTGHHPCVVQCLIMDLLSPQPPKLHIILL